MLRFNFQAPVARESSPTSPLPGYRRFLSLISPTSPPPPLPPIRPLCLTNLQSLADRIASHHHRSRPPAHATLIPILERCCTCSADIERNVFHRLQCICICSRSLLLTMSNERAGSVIVGNYRTGTGRCADDVYLFRDPPHQPIARSPSTVDFSSSLLLGTRITHKQARNWTCNSTPKTDCPILPESFLPQFAIGMR